MRLKQWFPVYILAISLLTAGCHKNSGDQNTRLTLTGSSTIAPLAQELAQRYEEMHPGVKIDVQAGGSSRGINDTRQGLVQIGMVSRGPKPEESDLKWHTIARDGIAIIVHQDNPVNTLSSEQIIAIYTGKQRMWNAFGGNEQPVTVVNKAEGRSTLELFLQHFKLKASEMKTDIIIGDNQQGIKTVSGNPNAIAYVSIGSAEYEVAHGAPIKLLPLNGIIPTTKAVQDGSFPLARPLNFVTKETPTGLAREFIDFAQSSQAYQLVEKQYFVTLSAPAVSAASATR
jgi:phosphate transport system substrate-binding protein